MRLPLVFLLAASLLLTGCASVGSSQRVCFHRSESIEKDIGFCQALRSGSTLHISGVAGEGSMDSAVRSVYGRLGQILEANGLSFANVVKENVYATDLDAFIKNREIRKEFYGSVLPAATWVQVQRLYVASFVVEIELTAEYPKRGRRLTIGSNVHAVCVFERSAGKWFMWISRLRLTAPLPRVDHPDC